MLGQLFHSLTPSRHGLSLSRQGSQTGPQDLESATEDAHTSALLFPTSDGNNQASHHHVNDLRDMLHRQGGFDEYGDDTGLPGQQDIRILIAQDEANGMPKSILFDSDPSTSPSTPVSPAFDRPPSRMFGFSSSNNQIKNDEVSAPASPTSKIPRTSTAHFPTSPKTDARWHGRGGSFASMPSFLRSVEEPSKAFRSNHSRGPSASSFSSVHSQRRAAKDADDELKSCMECMFGTAALRYAGHSTKIHIISTDRTTQTLDKSSSTASSYASAYTLPIFARPVTPVHISRPVPARRPSKLGRVASVETAASTVMITRVFSVNTTANTVENSRRKRKSPSYGISLMIRLPALSSRRRLARGPSIPEGLGSWSSSLGSEGRSFGSSRGSDSMVESIFFGTAFGCNAGTAGGFDGEGIMELIMQRWDVINRTLDHLQTTVHERILCLILESDSSTDVQRTSSLPILLGSPPSPHKIRKSDNLPPLMKGAFAGFEAGGLTGDHAIESGTIQAIARLWHAFSAKYVSHGLQAWDNWKEEARWINRWVRTDQHPMIMTDILSHFLSVHFDWVKLLKSTPHLQRDQTRGRRSRSGGLIGARTVVVSADKMRARRLVYVLSMFFPPSRSRSSSMPTPSTSEQGGSLSSPNRLTRQSNSKEAYHDSRGSSASNSHSRRNSQDSQRKALGHNLSALSAAIESSRRGSNSSSIGRSTARPAYGLSDNDSGRRTSSTVTVNNTIPVPFFAAASRLPAQEDANASGSRRGSMASSKLLDTLELPARPQRSELQLSVSTDRPLPREDSQPTPPTAERNHVLAEQVNNDLNSTEHGVNKLDQMVEELNALGITRSSLAPTAEPILQHSAPRDIVPPKERLADSPTLPPYSLSVNENDGFIDVHLPMDSYGSSMVSRSSTGLSERSTAPTAAFPAPPPSRSRARSSVAIGGYLPTFHQDLTLQAVRPYANLDQDIRSALIEEVKTATTVHRNSYTGAPSHPPVLVINADTGVVELLSHTTSDAKDTINSTHLIHTNADSSLTEKINNLLAHSTPLSQASSRASSTRNTSTANSGAGSAVGSQDDTSTVGTPPSLPGIQSPAQAQAQGKSYDSPRDACRKVVLGALEGVVRDVIADIRAEKMGEHDEEAGDERKTSAAGAAGERQKSMLRKMLREKLLEMGVA